MSELRTLFDIVCDDEPDEAFFFYQARCSNSIAVQKFLTFLPPAVMNRQFIRLSILWVDRCIHRVYTLSPRVSS